MARQPSSRKHAEAAAGVLRHWIDTQSADSCADTPPSAASGRTKRSGGRGSALAGLAREIARLHREGEAIVDTGFDQRWDLHLHAAELVWSGWSRDPKRFADKEAYRCELERQAGGGTLGREFLLFFALPIGRLLATVPGLGAAFAAARRELASDRVGTTKFGAKGGAYQLALGLLAVVEGRDDVCIAVAEVGSPHRGRHLPPLVFHCVLPSHPVALPSATPCASCPAGQLASSFFHPPLSALCSVAPALLLAHTVAANPWQGEPVRLTGCRPPAVWSDEGGDAAALREAVNAWPGRDATTAAAVRRVAVEARFRGPVRPLFPTDRRLKVTCEGTVHGQGLVNASSETIPPFTVLLAAGGWDVAMPHHAAGLMLDVERAPVLPVVTGLPSRRGGYDPDEASALFPDYAVLRQHAAAGDSHFQSVAARREVEHGEPGCEFFAINEASVEGGTAPNVTWELVRDVPGNPPRVVAVSTRPIPPGGECLASYGAGRRPGQSYTPAPAPKLSESDAAAVHRALRRLPSLRGWAHVGVAAGGRLVALHGPASPRKRPTRQRRPPPTTAAAAKRQRRTRDDGSRGETTRPAGRARRSCRPDSSGSGSDDGGDGDTRSSDDEDGSSSGTGDWDPSDLAGEAELHRAVRTDAHEALARLLSSRADVNVADAGGRTALHWAAARGAADVVEQLVDGGARVDAAVGGGGVRGCTPLRLAARRGHAVVVRRLVELRASVDPGDAADVTTLLTACSRGHTAVVRQLLDAGMGVDAGAEEAGDEDLWGSPLHAASHGGSVDSVVELVRRGADVHRRDAEGRTALHLAAREAAVDVASALLDGRADPNARDGGGASVLWGAVDCCDAGMARLLLERRAGVDSVGGEEASTPLHIAVECGLVGTVRALLEGRADVGARVANGQTALHWAASEGWADKARLLLEHKADGRALDGDGRTPLELARAAGHAECLQLFRDGAAGSGTRDSE